MNGIEFVVDLIWRFVKTTKTCNDPLLFIITLCKIDTLRLRRGTILRCRVTDTKVLGESHISVVKIG